MHPATERYSCKWGFAMKSGKIGGFQKAFLSEWFASIARMDGSLDIIELP